MRKILILILVVGLWGCAMYEQDVKTDILLSIAAPNLSKTDALTAGDEVAVFARVEGTQTYFLEAQKWVTGSNGTSLSASPAAYYPETKQAIHFFAYFPYHTGTFSVPTDQSTAVALKKADLCWAKASSTPVPIPISLSFEHQMARLVVSCTQTPTKIVVPNALSGGTLDVATGVFVPTLKSDLSTTGNELILPAQPLTRLGVEVAGKEYPFTPTSAVTLQAGQTTVLNLTLNPISQTATLAAPVVTTANWTATATTDEPGQAVDNQFTAHWLVADYRFNQINRIDLTIKNTVTGITKDYTTSGVKMVAGSTIAAASYTFALTNVPDLYYPYTVTALKFYQNTSLVHTATVNNSIAHTGAATLGWGQNISLTLSAATASVAATATSSTFTVTSNVPYTSSYTTGGASAQGVGAQPPYTNYSVTFTYPAQGSAAAAARTHVMTLTPTVDYTGNPNRRTFTVTQAAVPTSLSLSATAPGETVPRDGKTYYVTVTSNTSWNVNSASNISVYPSSGVAGATNVGITVLPQGAPSGNRSVSTVFITTNNAGLSNVTATWSGTQDKNAIRINGLWWAVGNLVASKSSPGAAGIGGCKIGEPTDDGLYFQFGSLTGFKGGNKIYGGTGQGNAGYPFTSFNGYYWNEQNSAYPGSSVDVMVWPTAGGVSFSVWPFSNTAGPNTINGFNNYFSYNMAPYATALTDLHTYPGFSAGNLSVHNVGDPCVYYLGSTWRTPYPSDYATLCGNIPIATVINASNTPKARWIAHQGTAGLLCGSPNVWTAPDIATQIFIPVSGVRGHTNGGVFYLEPSLYCVTYQTICTVSASYPSAPTMPWTQNCCFFAGKRLNEEPWLSIENYAWRDQALSVRCVSN